MQFNLNSIPENAIIKEVRISLYPLNRVNVKIEECGEWSLSFVDQSSVAEIYDYNQMNEAHIIETLGQSIPSENLTQGIWSHWDLNSIEKKILEEQLLNKKVLFKIAGPIKLPEGRDSQMMIFDAGYGNYGAGIHYRPSIDIKYTIPSQKIVIEASKTITIYKDKIKKNELICGFDENNCKIYGLVEFDLDNLPNFDETVITNCYIQIKNKSVTKTEQEIRYNIEFIDIEDYTCEAISTRDRIEFIGYEVSLRDLQKNKTHKFIFDMYSRMALENIHQNKKIARFIIKPTSADIKNHIVDWYGKDGDNTVKLIINYIKRRRKPIESISNLILSIDNNRVKLNWDNPITEDFIGVYVVRNRFHIPRNHLDGDKIYAGKDNYTYDNLGNIEIAKYYSVFAYDNVPNFSDPLSIEYLKGEEAYAQV